MDKRIIIQNDIGNEYSPTTIVLILTSKMKKEMPTHVILQFEGLEQESVVCAEQIKTIDKSRLESYRGNIGSEWMSKIGEAIVFFYNC